MGARNVRAALSMSPHKLTDTTRLVLVVMALHALDRDYPNHPAQTYFGGHELICDTLGWWPNETHLRRVRRAVTELTEYGIVERTRHPGPGQAQAYELHLPVHKPVDNCPPDTPREG